MKKSILLVFMFILLLSGCAGKPAKSQPVPAAQNPVQTEIPAPSISAPTATDKPVNTAPVATVKTLSWYFIRNNQHQYPDTNADMKKMLAQSQGLYVIPNDSKKIYLSFDCGYELGYGQRILDTLASKQVKAAFFITGQYIKTQPDLVKRMHADGHLVCNHTYNHPDLTTISQAKLTQEISSLEKSYLDLTGFAMDKYLRPPMGNFNANSLEWTKDLGYTTVFWSMAWKDWDPKQQPGADFVYQHVIDNIHPGAVILMHIVSQSDTEALDKIITELQAEGYVFSTFNN